MNDAPRILDAAVRARAQERCRERRILLPTVAELGDPSLIPPRIQRALERVDPDAPHPLNLFRVHWHNARDPARQVEIPEHLLLPPSLTGVPAPVAILLGNRFPMIQAHKVLAAYACLAPRLVSGGFDPTTQRALWPSTGNYCRGGVAISKIMGCRGVAILPAGMSQERFAWLEQWVEKPEDIIKTPGSESNVKEIYDACRELAQDPAQVVFNQFREYGNHLVHRRVTGAALARVAEHLRAARPSLVPRLFVSASGSAGTLGAGEALKERYGLKILAAEALECPTLLRGGFGSHNIQGIGDKHVPLIHNVMNTDLVAAISDRSTDRLLVLFNSEAGRAYLQERRGVPPALVRGLGAFGLSSICNLLAAIKGARQLDLGPDDLILTVATDGAALYGSEQERIQQRDFPGGLDLVAAAETAGEHLWGQRADHVLELQRQDRERIFNLGYYTWVEQQGVSLAEFNARREPAFWKELDRLPDLWDDLIRTFNAETGVLASL